MKEILNQIADQPTLLECRLICVEWNQLIKDTSELMKKISCRTAEESTQIMFQSNNLSALNIAAANVLSIISINMSDYDEDAAAGLGKFLLRFEITKLKRNTYNWLLGLL